MDDKDERSDEPTGPGTPEPTGAATADSTPTPDDEPGEAAVAGEADAGPPASLPEGSTDRADEAEDGSVLPAREVRAIVEALIFACPQPITPREIGRVLVGVPREDWQRELEALRGDYRRDERGLQLVEVAGGWQVTTRPPTGKGMEVVAEFKGTNRERALREASNLVNSSRMSAAQGIDPKVESVPYATNVPAVYVIHDPSSSLTPTQ